MGAWRITDSELWGRDALDLVEDAFVRFGRQQLGDLAMIALRAAVDYRLGTNDGRPSVDFSFGGEDDGDHDGPREARSVSARVELSAGACLRCGMLTHNTYFEGRVQSVGFERNGRKTTVGVIDVGEFHFGTGAPERMTVVSGELAIRLDGTTEWRAYPAGTAFEVPRDSGFDVRAAQPAGYVCEFL